MNDVLFGLLLTLIEYIKIFLILWGIAGIHPKKKFRCYLFSIIPCIACVTISGMFFDYETTMRIGLVIGTVISIHIFIERSWIRKLLLHFVIAIMSSLFNVYVFSLAKLIISEDASSIYSDQMVTIICNSVTIPVLLIILIVFIVRGKEHIIEDFSVVWPQYLILLLGMACCYLVINGTQMILLALLSEEAQKVVFAAINGSCMFFFIISVWQIKVTSSRNYYKNRDAFRQKYIDMQEQHFAEILEKDNQLRSFRHDLRSHMIVISELSTRGEYDKLNEYTKRILDKVDSFKRFNYSGNSVVDTVVSDIMKNHENDNIEIIWHGQLPMELNIDSFDLCAIISNIVKNAIEACLKIDNLEKRKIYINTDMYEGVLSIHEHNDVVNTIKMFNGKPQTDKKDKTVHGYGTSNIEKCASKYNGVVKYNVADGIFSIDVLLHQ